MLNNGDVLGVHYKSFFSFFTKLFQFLGGQENYKISHVGIAREINGLWYSQEMDGRFNVLRPISQYTQDNIKINIYRGDNVNCTNDIFDRFMVTPISYNVSDLLKIGFQLLTKFKNNGYQDDDEMVCSGYSAAILQASGWIPPKGLTKMPSPSQLCNALTLIGKM
jgi:hypothetical protein